MYILYIAGPMAMYAETDFNYPAFAQVAEDLRKVGYEVISPHEVDPDKKPGDRHYLWYVRHTLKQLLECQGVAVLPDIHYSSGALRECELARHLNMPVHDVAWWLAAAVNDWGLPVIPASWHGELT